MANDNHAQLIDILSSSFNNYPQQIAIIHKKQQLNYHQLDRAIKVYALHLLSLGVNTDDKVAIYDNKSIQTIIAFFAISLIGAVFIPINPLLKSRQLKHILTDSEAKILITSSQRLNLIDLEDKSFIIILSDFTKVSSDLNFSETNNWQTSYWPDINQTINSKNNTMLQAYYHQDKLEKLCALFYTSGSTGKAKGVCISHQNLISATKIVAEYCEINHQDRILSLLPYSFDYGFNQICTTLYKGATLVLTDYLLPKDIGIAIEKYQITGLAGVPSLWIHFNKINFEQYPCHSLRFITNSGGKLPASIIRSINNNLSELKIFLMYGLTEAFRSTYLSPEFVLSKINSIGKALPGENIYIVDESGKPCEINQTGELVHYGQLVSMGYWNRPDENQKRFKYLNENYFKECKQLAVFSGDYAKQDADGFFYFINRKDDQIKCSGNRISPTEVEDVLYEYPDIIENIALGIPHHELGEAIVIICTTTASFIEKDFIKYCKTHLPNFMHPKKVIIEDSLPKSGNGKIDRKFLKNKYKQLFNLN